MALTPEQGPRPGATPDQGLPQPVSRPLFILAPDNFPGYQEYMEEIKDLPDTATQFAGVGLTPERAKEAREKIQLLGRVYLVVGTGPESMGEASALELVARGATVVGVTRSESGSIFVTKTEGMHGEPTHLQADITTEDPQELIKKVIQTGRNHNFAGDEIDRLDGIVIASGARKDKLMVMASDEDVKAVMEANFHAPFRLVQAGYRVMRGQWRRSGIPGRISVLSSMAAQAAPAQGGYGPSKAALDNAVRSISIEAERRDPKEGVYINTADPGLVNTSFVENMTDEMRVAVLVDTKAARELEAKEVGVLLAHLVTEDAYFEDVADLLSREVMKGENIQIVGRGDVVNFNHHTKGYHSLDHNW